MIDGPQYEASLPAAAEAIFNAPGVHHHFLAATGLSADDFPHLRLRLEDWEAPFAPWEEEE